METAKETVKQEEEKGQESKTIEEWEKIKRIIHGAMVRKKIKKKRKELGFKDWWDRSCTRKKREVKRIYIKWKRGKIEKKIYEEEEIQRVTGEETKRKKGRGRRIKEDEKGSRGLEIYKQEERKKWNKNNIREEWRNYFRNLLEGAEGEEVIEEKEKRGEEQEAEEIEEAEVREAVRKTKRRKAAGVDGIPMEAWKFAGERLWRKVVELMRRI